MSGPKPGQIRCPTCHRSTPPAPFCTNCGTAIPSGARTRPRGFDRDELQARIRARRSGQPYLRRGTPPAGSAAPPPDADRWGEEPVGDAAGPEPWGEAEGDREPGEAHVVEDAPTLRTPAPAYGRGPDYDYEPERYDRYDERYAQPYGEDEYLAPVYGGSRRPPRRSSAGPLLVVGLIALGALALLAGGVLAMFTSDQTGSADPDATPTATLRAAPTPEPTATAPSPAATPTAASSPGATVASDGFTAQAEPCLGEPINEPRCPASGEVVSAADGTVFILVTFDEVNQGDTISVRGTGPDGRGIGEASWDADGDGSGWAYFGYALAGLAEGTYDVEVTRNGDPVAETEFAVEG